MKTDRRIHGYLDKDRFRVSIFGSARVDKKDQEYKEVFELAKELGERGIDVITGGGPGLMEAAAEGHKKGSRESKAKAIGLGIKLPKEQKFNNYLDYKETFMRFTQRLDNFMLYSNAVIVAPGGVGTLLELLYTWQLVQVKKVNHIPIILMGDMWPGLIEWLKKSPLKRKYFTNEDLKLLFLVKNHKEAMKVIDTAYKEFCKGSKDFCVNYKAHGK